jgi:hypothetical protein
LRAAVMRVAPDFGQLIMTMVMSLVLHGNNLSKNNNNTGSEKQHDDHTQNADSQSNKLTMPPRPTTRL